MSDETEPNPGTKAYLERQVADLQAEVERLRGQLATAGAALTNGPVAVRQQFLSEGERQELELRGVTTDPATGRRVTTEQARARLAASDTQQGVEIDDALAPVTLPAVLPDRPAQEGVTHVYPSVAPGLIDPAVAGTPGINGPAAPAGN
jgi:hypothetical protein